MFYRGYNITEIKPNRLVFEKIKDIDDIIKDSIALIFRAEQVLNIQHTAPAGQVFTTGFNWDENINDPLLSKLPKVDLRANND